MVAAAVGFDRHEYRIDVFESLGILSFQNPPFLVDVIFVEDAEVESLLFARIPPAPCLKRTGVPNPGLCVQITRIIDQRFAFCIENVNRALSAAQYTCTPGSIEMECAVPETQYYSRRMM